MKVLMDRGLWSFISTGSTGRPLFSVDIGDSWISAFE